MNTNLILSLRWVRICLGAPVIAALASSGNAQTAPVITLQPVSLSRSLGDTATFTVNATGTAPLAYQWHKEDQPVDNATNRILTLSNLWAAAAGSYKVVVSNSFGSVTSDAATLDVETTFTRILTGPGATRDTESASWVDYDGDGRLDLLVVGIGGALFHN